MIETRLDEMSKEQLIRELEKRETAARRFAARTGEPDREGVIYDLHIHQVELEMQNREFREAQERLEETTARYSDLYDFAPVGYCTLGPDGEIREINLAGAALLGAPRVSLLGQLFSVVAPLTNKTPFLAHLRRCAQEGSRATCQLEFARRSARAARVLQLVSEPVRDPHGQLTACRTILVDISDLKAMEDRLRLLSDAGARLASSLDFASVLDTAARCMVPALADLCILDVLSGSGTIERAVVLFSDVKKQKTLAAAIKDFALRPGWLSPQAQVVASGEPMLVSEVSSEQQKLIAYNDHHADLLRAAGLRSILIVPLSVRGRTFGALTLAAVESDRRYTAEDLRLAQDLARRVAMAADNARLYDETERANQRLLVAEAKASGIVSSSPDAIISVDEDQRITLWNEGARKIFGYSRGEAVGLSLGRLVPERFRSAHQRAVEDFALGPEVTRSLGEGGGTIVGLRRTGEEFPADAAISKLHVAGQRILTVTVRDVTEAKRIEGEQRFFGELGKVLGSSLDYEHTLTSVVGLVARELADYAVLYTREDDGTIRRVRAASRDTSDWYANVLLQIHGEAGREHTVSQVIAAKQPVLMAVTAALLPSLAHSEEHLHALRAANLRSMICVPLLIGSKCTGALVLKSSARVYGATDLRLAEEVGRRAALFVENAKLHRDAQRAINARDDVLAIVAHDLRNPLGAILMEAAMLRMTEQPTRSSRDSADAIDRAATRMKRLIRDLLDVSRMESGAFPVDRARLSADETITDFVAAQRTFASSVALELQLDVAKNLGEVMADRDRILQVLENLVSNAEKFTNPGGRVTVGASAGDDELVFWVADTGTGIEEADLPHIFDRYWSGRRTDRRGTGLGLPIVKGIVEAHGGRVWVESRVGEGSTFYFTLPRAPSVACRIHEAEQAHVESGHWRAPLGMPTPTANDDVRSS